MSTFLKNNVEELKCMINLKNVKNKYKRTNFQNDQKSIKILIFEFSIKF